MLHLSLMFHAAESMLWFCQKLSVVCLHSEPSRIRCLSVM